MGHYRLEVLHKGLETIDAPRNLDLLVNTNLSPQRVAWIVFRATWRYECCSRWFSTNITTQKKGLTHSLPALCDSEGPGLE